MKGYYGDIEKLTLENTYFRKVLYTAKHSQLVLMSIKPMGEIGEEIHPHSDQFLRFEKGVGTAYIDGNEYKVMDGMCIIVPAGSKHNVINNSSTEELKLYTIYSPAHHLDGIIHKTREDAMKNDPEWDGKTTE